MEGARVIGMNEGMRLRRNGERRDCSEAEAPVEAGSNHLRRRRRRRGEGEGFEGVADSVVGGRRLGNDWCEGTEGGATARRRRRAGHAGSRAWDRGAHRRRD